MRIQVSGKSIDIGVALSEHVEDRLTDIVEKYAGRATDANVTFSRDAHLFVCDISAHLSTGMYLQAKGSAGDVYGGFDAAGARLEKQLRRYKRWLKDHHRAAPIEADPAPSYVLASVADESADDSPASGPPEPVIVAEMETKVSTLSVGEAVMQMELADKALLVFRNSAHGGVNVVYRREDGNVGWIDPRRAG